MGGLCCLNPNFDGNNSMKTGIKKVAESHLETQYYGILPMIVFSDEETSDEILVCAIGDAAKYDNPLVRIHSRCVTSEVFGSLHCDCAYQLERALDMIISEGGGILIYLNQEGRGMGLGAKLKAYELFELHGIDTVDAYERQGIPVDGRSYLSAVKVLKYFQVRSLRLLTNNPEKVKALENQGIRVERVPIEPPVNSWNKDYLSTKKSRMGHLFENI